MGQCKNVQTNRTVLNSREDPVFAKRHQICQAELGENGQKAVSASVNITQLQDDTEYIIYCPTLWNNLFFF